MVRAPLSLQIRVSFVLVLCSVLSEGAGYLKYRLLRARAVR
jgi:hypothetical protein